MQSFCGHLYFLTVRSLGGLGIGVGDAGALVPGNLLCSLQVRQVSTPSPELRVGVPPGGVQEPDSTVWGLQFQSRKSQNITDFNGGLKEENRDFPCGTAG